MSGIGVISGWSCLGGILELSRGGPRYLSSWSADTAGGYQVCLWLPSVMNWNRLGLARENHPPHSKWLPHDFSVLALGVEFLTTAAVSDFPTAGQGATGTNPNNGSPISGAR